MRWLLYALAGPMIWAVVNHLDKFIIGKYFQGNGLGSIVIFTGSAGLIISIFILLLNPASILLTSFSILVIFLNGALLIAAILPYLYALEDEEASIVSALYQLVPVFGYFLGLFFLDEMLSPMQIGGALLIIIGSIAISVDTSVRFNIKIKSLLLMSLTSMMIAVNYLIFKIVALEENFWGTIFWEYIGGAVFALALFLGIRSYRQQFLSQIRRSKAVIGLSFTSEFLNIAAKLMASFANLLAPLVLVWVVNGFQPFFALVYGIILTLFVPHIYKEKLERTYLLQKVSAIAVIIVGTILLF